MLLSFKTRLEPTNKQLTQFRRACGVSRHAYNWGNALILEILKERKTDKSAHIPSAIDLHKQLVKDVKSAHKLTTYLAKNHSEVKIEDLHVKAFLKNHKLAGAIAECGMHEFRRQLEYKTEKFSSRLILVARMFPSSQICSNCGKHRHKMSLKNRVYHCPDCRHKQDRDLNAARNIERWFEGIFIPERSDVAVSSTVSACGVDKPSGRQTSATAKQEVSSKVTHVQLCLDLGNFG